MDSAAVEQVIDLRPYMNTSPTPIPETFSLDRAYRMFTQLGLRHLVVVDHHNHVKGIVTRKVCLKLFHNLDSNLIAGSLDEWASWGSACQHCIYGQRCVAALPFS